MIMKMKKLVSRLMVLVIVFSSILSSPTKALAASSVIATGFNLAMGLAVADDGSIYVADHNYNDIKRIDPDGNNITTLGSEFKKPTSIAVSGGAIYVADYYNNKIKKMDINGNGISEISGTFVWPSGIALDNSGNIYVTCYSTGEIKKISADESTVTTITSGLISPVGVAVDSSGTIYFSQQHKGIYKMDSDGSNITTLWSGNCNFITIDSVGDLYAAVGNSIIKIDKNDNHVMTLETIATRTWGVALDKERNVYYTDGTSLYKITSGAATTDATHIQLSWKNSFEGTMADPEAFIIHGVATNPTVTEATVDGNILTLTLSAPIYVNDNITLDYTATGTNDLISIAGVGNLTNYVVTNKVTTKPEVTAVAAIPDIIVATETTQEEIGLPTTVAVTLSNSVVTGAAITWDNGSPTYDSNTEGTYLFAGTITLTEYISNSNNLKASASVVVAKNVKAVSSITVNGADGATTVREGNSLQMSASVLPSDATKTAVTWSVASVTGTGTISTDGLLTGTGEGIVTVYATAQDTSGVYGTKEVRITSNETNPSTPTIPTTEPTPTIHEKENKSLINIELSQEDIKDSKGQITIPVPMEELKQKVANAEITNVTIIFQLLEEVKIPTQVSGLILKAEVLETVKALGKDLSIIIKDKEGKERYTWMFKGDMSDPFDQELTDINLYMELDTLIEETDLQKMFKSDGTTSGMVLHFAHEGILPIQSRIKIYVGDQQGYTTRSKIYLYHYNKETGKLETLPYSSNNFVDEEGYFTAGIVHCSDYVTLLEEADTSMFTSLRKQIKVTVPKKTIYIGDNKNSSTEIKIELPKTLELVSSLKDATSQRAIGGVTVTYVSSDEKVAVIDAKGKILAVGAGKTVITTTLKLYSGKIKKVKTVITVK